MVSTYHRPTSVIFRYLFVPLLVFGVIGSLLLGDNSQPLVLAQNDATPTAIPGESLPSFFKSGLHPDLESDILLHPYAPIYRGEVSLIFRDEGALLLGTLTVIYTNQTDIYLQDIIFRLYPNLPSYGGSLDVTYAQIGGQTIQPQLDKTKSVLRLPLDQPIPPMQKLRITLQFESTVPVDETHLYAQYSFLHGSLALANFFPLLSVYEKGSGWWTNTAHTQGDAVYSESAYFDMSLTAPHNWVFITSGVSVGTIDHADGMRTSRYIGTLIRDFAVMGSPDYRTVSGTVADVTIEVHYLRGGYTAALTALAYAKNALVVYTSLFGRYPYPELDLAETYTTAGGIEYPGLIVIQSDSFNSEEPFLEFVVAHEIAHQWWYGVVGNDQTSDPWLDESLAQYSTALYYGAIYGPTLKEDTFASYQAGWDNYTAAFDDLPIGYPVEAYDDNAYFAIIYSKGPLFFEMLSDRYGEEIILSALTSYFLANRYAIATPAELLSLLELAINSDIDVLFDEWVGTTTH